MARKFLTAIDLVQNELQNARIQNLGTHPSTPVEGQIYWNTTDDCLYIYDGLVWDRLSVNTDFSGYVASSLFDANTILAATTDNTPAALTVGASTIVGRKASGGISAMTAAEAKAVLAIASGDVSGLGSLATLSAVGSAQITDGSVAHTDMANIATARIIGRVTASTGSREELTAAQVKTMLAIAHTDITDFDAGVQTNRLSQMAAPVSAIDMAGQKLTSVGTPTSSADAATKGYVDSVGSGLSIKKAVRAATVGSNITISTALNNGDVLDGVTLATGDRVLVKDQTNPVENGIYFVEASPVRTSDMNESGEVAGGTFVFVTEGTVNADSGWVVSTNDSDIVPGTDAMNWAQFSGAGQITAGTGLGKTGNTISITDAELLALAGLASAADEFPYFTGAGTAALATVTSAARTFLAQTSAANLFSNIKQAASESATGVVELATTAEATTGTDTSRAVTPAGVKAVADTKQPLDAGLTSIAGLTTLADRMIYTTAADTYEVATLTPFARTLLANGSGTTARATLGAGTVNKYAVDCAAATSTTVTHNLGTRDVTVGVYLNSGTYEEVECDVERTSTSAVTVRFATAPAAGAYRIVVTG